MTEILEEASSYRVNTALELSASESGAGENIGRTKIGPKSSISSFLGKSYMVPKAKCQLRAGEGGIAVHSDGAEGAMKAERGTRFCKVPFELQPLLWLSFCIAWALWVWTSADLGKFRNLKGKQPFLPGASSATFILGQVFPPHTDPTKWNFLPPQGSKGSL